MSSAAESKQHILYVLRRDSIQQIKNWFFWLNDHIVIYYHFLLNMFYSNYGLCHVLNKGDLNPLTTTHDYIRVFSLNCIISLNVSFQFCYFLR